MPTSKRSVKHPSPVRLFTDTMRPYKILLASAVKKVLCKRTGQFIVVKPAIHKIVWASSREEAHTLYKRSLMPVERQKWLLSQDKRAEDLARENRAIEREFDLRLTNVMGGIEERERREEKERRRKVGEECRQRQLANEEKKRARVERLEYERLMAGRIAGK